MIKKILYSFIIYMLFFGSLSAENLSYNSDKIIDLLNKAKSLEKTKKYYDAITVYNEVLYIASKDKLSPDLSFIYKKIGDIYYKQKQFEKAQHHFYKSILLDSLNVYTGDVHLSLGLLYRKQNNKDSLLIHLKHSLDVYDKKKNSKSKFNTHLKAGIIYKNLGNYNVAMRYLISAYEGFEELDLKEKLASTCNTIASTQRLLGHFEIAKRYYKKGLDIRLQLGDSLKSSYSYNNIGNLLKAEQKYDSAIAYYRNAIRFQPKKVRNKELGKYYYNLGTVYALQNKNKLAYNAYKKSLSIKKTLNDSISFSNTYNELASSLLKQKKVALSKHYLDSAKFMLNIKHNKDVLLRHLELQSKYFEQIGDIKKGLDYSKQFNNLYQMVFSEKQAKTVQELQERFESKQKSKKITSLTLGNNKQKEIISTQEKDIWLRNLIILICIILIIVAVLVYFLLKQKARVNQKKLELHRLESIFKGQEAIKEKISKDLHDIVSTSYDGIRLKILALPNEKNPEKIGERIVDEIAKINTEIRLISHRISPLWSKVKEHNLTDIIVEQLTEFQYYRKIFVDVQLPLPKEINSFSLESQTNFYGILLEALNNIQEHSQATEVTIQHQITNDTIRFDIIDNGIGFNQDTIQSGIGLLNMKQRAVLLRGDLYIKSSEKGTTITISFPIKINSI